MALGKAVTRSHRAFRASKFGAHPCERCGLVATLRSLDVAVAARPATKLCAASPAGWAPLLALCGSCWTDLVDELRALATPGEHEVTPR